MKGDKVDMSETIGAPGAMLGDDEFARRGLIAQGQMPGKEFALTADRADQIAGNADADENAPPSRTVARVRCGLSFRRLSALPNRQDHDPHDVAYDRQLKRPPTPCGQQD